MHLTQPVCMVVVHIDCTQPTAMFKKPLFLFLCLQSCILLNAQPGKTAITLSPAVVSMPDWYLAIQPGMQVQLNRRFSVVSELCFPVIAIKREPGISNQEYFRMRGELKYYLHPERSSSYVSIESSYTFRNFTAQDGSYFKGKEFDSVYTYQFASVHSPIWITDLRLGREYTLGPNFKLDLFAGMGFRNISTQYSQQKGLVKEVSTVQPYCTIYSAYNAAWLYEANIFRFNATLGLRLMRQL